MVKFSNLSRIFVLSAVFSVVAGTHLEDVANSLKPGEWADLSTNGLTLGLLEDVGGHNLLQWTDDAYWDPVEKQFLFLGQGHSSNWDGNNATGPRFIRYKNSDNSWGNLPTLPVPSTYHAYNHSALDIKKRRFYHRPANSTVVYGFDLNSKTWSANLPAVPSSVYGAINCCGGLEFFEQLNGFIMAVSGEVVYYNETTKNWSSLASGLAASGYCQFTEYSEKKGVVILGGRDSQFYQVGADGKVETLGAPPIPIDGCGSTVLTTDPNTGNFLLFGEAGGFYEYDPDTKQWTTHNATSFIKSKTYKGGVWGTVAAPIPELGVNFFLSWNWDKSAAFIYKHTVLSSTAAEVTPPAMLNALKLSINPNPFSSSVRLTVLGERKVPVKLQIHSVRGKLIASALWTGYESGSAVYHWSPRGHAPGVYLATVIAGKERKTARLFLNR